MARPEGLAVIKPSLKDTTSALAPTVFDGLQFSAKWAKPPDALSKDLKVDWIESVDIDANLQHPPSLKGFEEPPLKRATRSTLYRHLIDSDARTHRGTQANFFNIDTFR